jgi:hypothetical protein
MSLKNKKGIDLLKLTAAYVIFTAVTLFIAISFINASIVVDTSSSAAENKLQPVSAESSIQKSQVLHSLSGIPSDAEYLSFSADGRYCVYSIKGKLYVMDIQSDKVSKEIVEKNAISYAILMHDRNIIIYFTVGNGKITVNTYNIDSGQKTIQNSFKADNRAVIRQADYSSMTGHVSFDVFNGENDVIYYIDLMKKLIKTPVGGPIGNMALTNSRQTVYYEKGSMLFYQSQPVKSLKKIKTRLLGCDIKDYVYVQSLSDKTSVYVVKGANIVKKIRLDDAGFIKTYSNKNNVYLVYPDHIMNLSTDPAEKTTYDKNYGFKGIMDNSIYLSDGKGNIIIKDNGN